MIEIKIATWVFVLVIICIILLLAFFITTVVMDRTYREKERVLKEDIVKIYIHMNGGSEETTGEKLIELEQAVSRFLGDESIYNNGSETPSESKGGV